MNEYPKEHPLNVYRASAGSGKTHLLTGFYIKLLFDRSLLPETHSGEMKFSEILAVTFTNKATAEMKTRIIEELYKLSCNPRDSVYWKELNPEAENPGFDVSRRAQEIKDKATRLLVQILNEYSSFNISTIDSFFQKIIRCFARELNIPGNYEVELDDSRVLDASISNFLDKLDQRKSPEVFDWMLRFSQNRIAEGSDWNFRRELLLMVKKVLSSEAYRQHSDAIAEFTADADTRNNYLKMLERIQSEWRKGLQMLTKQAHEYIRENKLTAEQFRYKGAGNVSLFDIWANGGEDKPGSRFLDGANGKLLSDKNLNAQHQDLALIFQQCTEFFTGDIYRNYKTACAIKSHFYELGIMAKLDKESKAFCDEQNTMLLSSSSELLSLLIGDDDAPFIYEKTGTRIHSFMIDEFQDTSSMQWSNFKPLVSDSLSQQYQNLIVGDVKQSIYRWRGGDWSLLDSKLDYFEPDSHYNDSDSLDTNWRSLRTIVEFNNEFFPELALQLDKMLGNIPNDTDEKGHICKIYSDVQQKLASKNQGDDKPAGMVRIEMLDPKEDAEGNDLVKANTADYVAEASRRLPEVILEMQSHGYQPRDIAILCRYNRDCLWVAQALLSYKQQHPEYSNQLEIISGEALQIGVRPAIQTLINIMRHLLNPASDILRMIAWCNYYELEGNTADEAIDRYYAMPESQRLFHPELSHRPLYELTEELISLLPQACIHADSVFLQAFRDMVLDYTNSKMADLSGFLAWWDQTGYRKAIATPEEQNAIRIMSVHKSKGLGMPVVIIPYASWSLDIDNKHSELIWCEPHVEPFKQDILLPIQLNSDLSQTIFANDYREERERVVIDNINTAYVAFTRAKEVMVIMVPSGGKNGSTIDGSLRQYCKSKGSDNGLTLGQLPLCTQASQPTQPNTKPLVSTISDAQEAEPARRLPDICILHDPGKPDITAKERGTYIHSVLERIRTADEATEIIHRMYLRSNIDPTVISEAEMLQTISHLLSNPQVASWFSPGLRVLNEQPMVDKNGNLHRPDRVVIDAQGTATVIDYKTGNDHPGYQKQIKGYKTLLRNIGFKSVRGFLLFLKDESIVEV